MSRSKPDVLLIMVEGLGVDGDLCSDRASMDGLKILSSLCSEFSRWSRAYVPSTLTQPNVVSILSGQEPDEHQVLHNGAMALEAKSNTLAEVAISNGYRTGFFSGGLPVLNKFGVHQGFEHFDDTTILRDEFKGVIEKQTSLKATGLLSSWVENEISNAPFFASLYLPSENWVQDPISESPSDALMSVGSLRRKKRFFAIESLLEHMDGLGRLKNTVILWTGVSGSRHHVETAKETLSKSQTQVSFQLRHPKIVEGKTWNTLISTTLAYVFLRQILEGRSFGTENLVTESLKVPLKTRSDWGHWVGVKSGPSLAYRSDPFVFKLRPTLKIFDAFSDTKESFPLSVSDRSVKEGLKMLEREIDKEGLDPCFLTQIRRPLQKSASLAVCKNLNEESIPKRSSIFDFYQFHLEAKGAEVSLGELLLKKWKDGEIFSDSVAMGWLVQSLMIHRDWKSLEKIAADGGFTALELIAQMHTKGAERVHGLSQKMTGSPSLSCLSYFVDLQKSTLNFYKICDDISLLKVIEGLRKLKSGEKPMKSFWEETQRLRALREAKNRNFKMQMVNDVQSTVDLSYTFSELYFYIPAYQSFLKNIEVSSQNL